MEADKENNAKDPGVGVRIMVQRTKEKGTR